MFQDFDFVLEHFKARRRKLSHVDHFYGYFLLVLSEALVDVTAVSGSDFIRFFELEVSDGDLVLAEATAGFKKFGSGPSLPKPLIFRGAVVSLGRHQLIGRIVPLTHFFSIILILGSIITYNHK